ncbi:hypothetical protein [Flavivirga spongiicola]|uniref:Uncharacterized protein n=1 Tax=Flavivirga spongiicola TaxID=421621 RepID=A0ABU7XT10_9FLAO|nr:hypothetical protein [Flavivirga sp. MEBiC05379]MDO5978573.1 hypothetical protein [Flavivirga sp. MEBiC05379]
MKNYYLLSILLLTITISGYSQNKLTKEERRTLRKIGLIIKLTNPDAVPPRNIAESTLGGRTYNGLSEDEHFKRSDKSLQILNKIVDDIDPYNFKSSEIIFSSIESFSSNQDPIKIVKLDNEFQLLLADPPHKKDKTDRVIHNTTDEIKLKMKNERIETQKKYDTIYQYLKNNGFDGLLTISIKHWSTFAVKFQLGNGPRWTSQANTGYYARIFSIDDKLLFHKKYFSKTVPALKYKKTFNDFIKDHTEKVFKEIMK